MTRKRRKTGVKIMTDDRLCRRALLSAMRTLRQSARKGRPISLPNLLRLFQRRCAECGGSIFQARAYQRLENWYRQRQPFGRVTR
jgi:hypothetical protein